MKLTSLDLYRLLILVEDDLERTQDFLGRGILFDYQKESYINSIADLAELRKKILVAMDATVGNPL